MQSPISQMRVLRPSGEGIRAFLRSLAPFLSCPSCPSPLCFSWSHRPLSALSPPASRLLPRRRPWPRRRGWGWVLGLLLSPVNPPSRQPLRRHCSYKVSGRRTSCGCPSPLPGRERAGWFPGAQLGARVSGWRRGRWRACLGLLPRGSCRLGPRDCRDLGRLVRKGGGLAEARPQRRGVVL